MSDRGQDAIGGRVLQGRPQQHEILEFGDADPISAGGRPNVGKRLVRNSLFGMGSSSITYVTLHHYLKKCVTLHALCVRGGCRLVEV
jgi:hypothetical protein